MYICKMETWFVLCLGWLKLRDFCFNFYFLICKMFQHSAWYWDFIDTFGSQAPEPLSRAYVFSIRALKLLQLLPLLYTLCFVHTSIWQNNWKADHKQIYKIGKNRQYMVWSKNRPSRFFFMYSVNCSDLKSHEYR